MRCPICNEDYDSGTICPNCGEVTAPRMHSYAIGALLMAVFGICLPFALIAIPLAITALVHIHRAPGVYRGKWLAITSFVFIVGWSALYTVFFTRPSPHEHTKQTFCTINQRQLALAVAIYTQENNEQLPSSFSQLDIAPKMLVCPEEEDLPYGYGLNWYARGRSLNEVHDPSTTLLTADGGNHHHYIASRRDIDGRRHKHAFYIASFIDGHVEQIQPTQRIRLRLH